MAKPILPAGDLSAQQRKALAALVAGDLVDDVAKAAGVSRVTIWRWMQLPEFASAVRQARAVGIQEAASKLQAASGRAVATLIAALDDEDHEPSRLQVRVRAAEIILSRAQDALETAEFNERLAALEAAVNDARSAAAS